MTLNLDKLIDKKLFVSLERGIPIARHPFLEIGNQLGISEDEVLDKIKQFSDSDLIRRFGAIFDNTRLGYRSALCALKVADSDLDRISNYLKQRKEITHCYIRNYDINLWFTFSCLDNCFNESMNEIKTFISPNKILFLPAVKRYKISVIFDLGINLNNEIKFDANLDINEINRFDEIDKNLIINLRNLPIDKNPFALLSEKLNISEKTILAKITYWKNRYILKRISLIPYHYKIGYKSNAMCVWNIEQKRLSEIGELLSSKKEVTHCYERAVYPEFPYNIYAMIHGNSHEITTKIFHDISQELSLNNGKLLFSTKEIKKTSLELFA